MRFRPTVCIILTMLANLAAEGAEHLQRPHWIWAGPERSAASEVTMVRSFDVPAEFNRAALWLAADFAQAQLWLNDRPVAVQEPYEGPSEIEVTPYLDPGQNTIRIRATGCRGPSAVALRITIEQAGQSRVLVSDEAWATATGQPVVTLGQVAAVPWLISSRSTEIQPFDDYTQWKRSLADSGSSTATYSVQPGFELQQLKLASAAEGSWVSLAFDPRGRLVIAKEDRGLLRLTLDEAAGKVQQIELINDALRECRGLLFAFDALYVNANQSRGLYRLRDTNGDDQFDETKLLYHSQGGTGHGRNDLTLGPDGMIYSIHGDAVDLPRDFRDRTSPFREHRRGAKTREGHVIRTDANGETWELLVGGLRNPYGIAIHRDGEMFTYDADAEFDMGSPWYRPTRVSHLVTGADYGWRGVTGTWPPYFPDHPDAARPNLDIGKGSPTAVEFGYGSNFPPLYRSALFVLDWAYGRILCVHITPRGASYFCRARPFVRGRPLNVTDLAFGPDGAMYFVTGGRKTQSGLFRVRYVGPEGAAASEPTPQRQARAEHARRSRQTRRQLESLQLESGDVAIDQAWPFLNDDDPWIRYAARCAIEQQPLEIWQQLALQEPRVNASLNGLMALARSGQAELRPLILARLVGHDWEMLDEHQLLSAIHICSLCDVDTMQLKLQRALAERLEPLYPHASNLVNRALSQLLVTLRVASVVPRTLRQLEVAAAQVDQFHALFVLRNAARGWTVPRRREYFAALNRTDHFLGGQGLPGFLENIRQDAVAGLNAAEREACADLLAGTGEPDYAEIPQRPFVRRWQLAELTDKLATSKRRPDFERGQTMYQAALCARCHRLGGHGRSVGPELTSVARRFSRRNLLESILLPSQVIADDYRSQRLVTSDGRVFEGRVVYRGDYRAPTLMIATDPLTPSKVTEIVKSEIESHAPSPVSFMPEGLLNTLHSDEIFDLLAFIQAGGDPQHPIFRSE